MRRSILVLGVLLLVACGDDDANGANGGKGNGGDGDDPFGNSTLDRDASTSRSEHPDGAAVDSRCGSEPFEASPMPVNLLLVIDKSGSMKDIPSGFGSDKWSAMKDSLGSALASLPEQVSLGLQLYPKAGCDLPEGSDIDVEVQPAADALPHVQSALEQSEPGGGTPTAAALARALGYFTQGAGKQLTGAKYVLLATDGGPNCNDALQCADDVNACTVNLDGQCPSAVQNCCDEAMAGPGAQVGCLDDVETRASVEALATAGIPTFVIGIPGTESYATLLDELAMAGGRANKDGPPSYFAVTREGTAPGGLTSVLSAITSSVLMSCRLTLGSTPPALDKLNVQVDGKVLPQKGPDGWALDTTTDPPTVELKGATCERVEREGVQNITVLFGCPTVVQ